MAKAQSRTGGRGGPRETAGHGTEDCATGEVHDRGREGRIRFWSVPCNQLHWLSVVKWLGHWEWRPALRWATRQLGISFASPGCLLGAMSRRLADATARYEDVRAEVNGAKVLCACAPWLAAIPYANASPIHAREVTCITQHPNPHTSTHARPSLSIGCPAEPHTRIAPAARRERPSSASPGLPAATALGLADCRWCRVRRCRLTAVSAAKCQPSVDEGSAWGLGGDPPPPLPPPQRFAAADVHRRPPHHTAVPHDHVPLRRVPKARPDGSKAHLPAEAAAGYRAAQGSTPPSESHAEDDPPGPHALW